MERRLTKFSIVTAVEQTDDDDTELKSMSDFTIVYLCLNIDNHWEITNELLKQLRYILHTTKQFTDINECLDFVTDLVETKVFLVIDGYPKQSLLSIIHQLEQIYSIYIFSTHEERHKSFVTVSKLVKGVYGDIEHMCKVIKRDISNFMKNLTAFSIIQPGDSVSLGQLDPSFMYTQLLKEIITELEYDKMKEREKFVQFCLNSTTLDISTKAVTRFQQSYETKSPIWWYSKEGFVYSLINLALRTLDVDIILKMGFFLQDLHREIECKHAEQKYASKINVYRGQGLSIVDFEQLKKSKGGLFSFNSFLSTSLDYETSYAFADSNRGSGNMIGILFKIEIDPTLSSTPFVSLDDMSAFKDESEILFSMHTIFRIGDMTQIDDTLWEVCLVLTTDNDSQLKNITDFIRKDISTELPCDRLLMVLRRLGRVDKVYEILSAITQRNSINDLEISKGYLLLLESFKSAMLHYNGDYSAALSNAKELLRKAEALFPHDQQIICIIHANIGAIYNRLGQFSDAISHCHKALELCQQIFPIYGDVLFQSYTILGEAYIQIGNYPIALSYCEKTLKLQQKLIPTDHPDVAVSLCNIGTVQMYMGEYSIARSNMEKALKIELKYLPLEHFNIGSVFQCIGVICNQMKDYSNALYYHQKALNNYQKNFPSDHPYIGQLYMHISTAYYYMKNYTNALSYVKLALDNLQKKLRSDHPDLAFVHSLIGEVYRSTGEYANALVHHEKALEICHKSHSSDNPNIVNIYINIGTTQQSLGNYSMALSYYEKALPIQRKYLSPHHPELVNTQRLIYSINMISLDLSSISSSFAKIVENEQKTNLYNQSAQTDTSNDKNDLLKSYSEICPKLNEFVEIHQNLCSNMNSESMTDTEYDIKTEKWIQLMDEVGSNVPKSLEFVEECSHTKSAEEIRMNEVQMEAMVHFKNFYTTNQNTLFRPDKPLQSVDQLSLGIKYQLEALEIQQKSLPPNDVTLSSYYNFYGEIYSHMMIYSEALSLFEKALINLLNCTEANKQLVAKTHNNMSTALEGLHQYEEAVDHVQLAIEIAQSTLGTDHPETQIYRTHFQQLYDRILTKNLC